MTENANKENNNTSKSKRSTIFNAYWFALEKTGAQFKMVWDLNQAEKAAKASQSSSVSWFSFLHI
jgi:hypothetical protein